MSNPKVGDRVRVKSGVTDRCKKSSMLHWQIIPNIDGATFIIERLTNSGKTCALNLPNLPSNTYELPISDLEIISD